VSEQKQKASNIRFFAPAFELAGQHTKFPASL
jgi:hypothetical protein